MMDNKKCIAGIVDYGRDRNDSSVFMTSIPAKFDSSLVIIIIISATKIIIIIRELFWTKRNRNR
jgi:hypothetical protein